MTYLNIFYMLSNGWVEEEVSINTKYTGGDMFLIRAMTVKRAVKYGAAEWESMGDKYISWAASLMSVKKMV